MISLTFSRAILLFFVIQTLLFLLLLRISDTLSRRVNMDRSESLKISTRTSSIIVGFLYVILIAGNILTVLGGFRYSLAYNIIIVVTPVILMLLLTMGSQHKLLFATTLLWHIMLLGLEMPPDLLSITEGVHMTRTMIVYGKWLPELAHNPSYNPFPTMAFIRVALSYVTSVPWYTWSLAYSLLVTTTIAFDLTIFTLVMKVTLNYRSAILGVIIGALTPYLVVTGHAYQVPANIMWLLSIAMFIKMLRERRKEDIIPIILLFLTSILTHSSTYVAMAYPPLLILVEYLSRGAQRIHRSNPYLKVVILTLLTIGIIRVAYEELYLRYVYKLAYGGITSLTNRILALFIEEEGLEGLKLSLYDYAGVPFYQAFLWTLTASSASALILHYLLKKHKDTILLSLFLAGALFITLGYAMATFTIASTQLYRSAYVAFSFFIPLASIAVDKIISSRKTCLVITMVTILMISSFLTLRDPEISPSYRLKARGIPVEVLNMQPTQSDVVKANLITALVDKIDVIKNLAFYSKSCIHFERITTYGLRISSLYSKFSDAIHKVLYIHGYTIGDAPIVNINVIMPNEFNDAVLHWDVILSLGEDIVFMMV